jgi:hypothetical protein
MASSARRRASVLTCAACLRPRLPRAPPGRALAARGSRRALVTSSVTRVDLGLDASPPLAQPGADGALGEALAALTLAVVVGVVGLDRTHAHDRVGSGVARPRGPPRGPSQLWPNAHGPERRRFCRTSVAKLAAVVRSCGPACNARALRPSARAEVADRELQRPLLGAESQGGQRIDDALGEAGWLVDRRVAALISLLRRRMTVSPTRRRSSSSSSDLRVNRTGSSASSRPENERVWPLCGVAVRKRRCSNHGAICCSIRARSESAPKLAGARLWASSTMSRSQRRRPSSPGSAALRNCSSTSAASSSGSSR